VAVKVDDREARALDARFLDVQHAPGLELGERQGRRSIRRGLSILIVDGRRIRAEDGACDAGPRGGNPPAAGPARPFVSCRHDAACYVRRRRLEVGGWRLEVGGWRLEVGGWRLEVGGWRLEVGGWRLGGWLGSRLAAQMSIYFNEIRGLFVTDSPKTYEPHARQNGSADRPERERAVDSVLADSFPASDPPSWTSGIARPESVQDSTHVDECPPISS
jgi:hypothetical protein